MNEDGTKGCPKCSEVMASGSLSVKGGPLWEINWRLEAALGELREKVAAFRCRKCGYVKLYTPESPPGDEMP